MARIVVVGAGLGRMSAAYELRETLGSLGGPLWKEHSLATVRERGLEAMIADGSFEALFQQHHGATLEHARLETRRVIELENLDLPAQTPFRRPELWYRPNAPR